MLGKCFNNTQKEEKRTYNFYKAVIACHKRYGVILTILNGCGGRVGLVSWEVTLTPKGFTAVH